MEHFFAGLAACFLGGCVFALGALHAVDLIRIGLGWGRLRHAAAAAAFAFGMLVLGSWLVLVGIRVSSGAL